MSEQRWDAIVIGSGLGGLTAAAYLATNGVRPLVLEQYDVVGGCSHVFRRKREFEFDVGVHYFGDCGPDGLLSTILRGIGLGGKIDFLPMDPEGFDTLVFPDFQFRVRRGWDAYEQDLLAAFPDEQKGMRKCVALMRKISAQAMAAPGLNSVREIMAIPVQAPTVTRWVTRTLADLFDACKLGDRARAVLAAQSPLYGAPPSQISALMHSIIIDHMVREGAYYPKGGGQVIAAHLVDVIRSHGGTVRTQARVEKILLEKRKVTGVRLTSGEELHASTVISNAEPQSTYLDLVGPEHLRRRTVGRMRKAQMSSPLFCVYLGLDIDLRERMPNTNYYYWPSVDMESAYRDCDEGRFPDQPPVYITAASVKDRHTESLAPPGCSTLQAMTMAPAQRSYWRVEEEPESARSYSRNPDYRSVKEEVTERIIDAATEVIPDIREHIVWKESGTPVTYNRYIQATGGSAYGLMASPAQWGLKRPRPKTEIGGLFLTGASTTYTHGVLGTVLGGLTCAGVVLGRDLRTEVTDGAVFADTSRLTAGGPGWDPLEASRRLAWKKSRPRSADKDPAQQSALSQR